MMNDNIFITQTEPNEEYVFNYTTEELTELFKFQRKTAYKKPFVFTIVLLLITILAIVISAPQFSTGFAFGTFVFGIINIIKSYRRFNKIWNNNIPKIAQTTYEYKIYDDYFIFNLYRNNEKTRQAKCFVEDIEQMQKLDKWLLLQMGGQAVILRESDLKENSVFFSYLHTNKK